MNSGSYSFCEAAEAGSQSKWHIRPLTHQGKKLGGGADTMSLCRRKVAWDVNAEITYHHLQTCCPDCREAYVKATSG